MQLEKKYEHLSLNHTCKHPNNPSPRNIFSQFIYFPPLFSLLNRPSNYYLAVSPTRETPGMAWAMPAPTFYFSILIVVTHLHLRGPTQLLAQAWTYMLQLLP
jgi:hypothetical protein